MVKEEKIKPRIESEKLNFCCCSACCSPAQMMEINTEYNKAC